MAGKRFFEDFDSDLQKPTEKRMKSRPSFASVIGEVIMVNSLNNLCSALEPLIRKVVNEELERGLKRRSSSFRIEAQETPTLKLIFSKKLAQPIFTGSKITDVDKNPLEIQLVEMKNGSFVKVNLNRLIKLDIVALHGDFPTGNSGENWSSEEFESNIVKERDGKRPLLAGEVTVIVRNGVGTISDIEFTDNSSWIRSRKFRIGAKVARGSCQDVRIREAMTEAFVVRDHRGELYKKHHPPMLEDDVWRLEKIGKEGAFHKKLSAEGVNTVQDFLKLSIVDPPRLKMIMGPGMSEKMWEVTLKHARECVMGNKFYIFRGPNFFLVLNPICQVIKAVVDGHIFPARDITTINRSYLEGLVRQAYTNWSSLEEIEGTLNEPALLTQGDSMVQQHGVNHTDVGRSNQQTGSGLENWEMVNGGYGSTPVELGFRFSITESYSQGEFSSF
ncbi:PREDICTED: protein SAR DEFICIENT 1 [Tarenaya hassleriana]|uniref:protein SAR DEFICIENT 1 n=1 Tax=Tarenaya hassleriana TaxID=28532 RepID=UPI00053C7B59|nr:PREDICTED: protein SAR DEFICIENT 1 [Tarenaya hassleriana]